MLTIDRLGGLGRLPLLVKVGLLVMATAGFADVIAHLEAGGDGQVDAHASWEVVAHLAGLVSMILILLGVVIDGVRQGRPRRTSPGAVRKESLDAVR